jgi:hypothetical protein
MTAGHSTATLNGQANDVWANYWKFGALATGTPTASTAGTELTGGTPAYARKAVTPGTSSAGSNVASAITFDVPASSPANFEGFTLVAAGVYSGWVGFTAIVFGVQGQLIVTPTATQA